MSYSPVSFLSKLQTSSPSLFAHFTACEQHSNLQSKFQFTRTEKPRICLSSSRTYSSATPYFCRVLQHSVPLAASVAILIWSSPANAGFLSGYSGIESVPGPQLPQIDFLNRFNEENQKKYAEADARFKSSPLLNKLLEQSKLNKEKNRQGILDKYCIRGAEWGVGDCSAEGMTPDERENFISMLKKKAGVE